MDQQGWPGFLAGGGEMGALLRAHDWAATPLGPVEAWPERLKMAVVTCLDAALPTYVWWGEELTQIYNDAALDIMRAKHPAGFGQPAREAWSEVWPVIGPLVEQVVGTGEAIRCDDLAVVLDRGGGPREEAFLTFSYSPFRDEGGRIAGMLITAIETTARIAADRAFHRMFAASPTPFLIIALDVPRFTITEVNDAYLAATMRRREALIGRGIFEAFPDNPADTGDTGVNNLRASLERALATKRPDAMPVQRYDIPHRSGEFEERWWDPVNTPVLDDEGEVTALIHHVTDVTEHYRAEQALRASETRYRQIVEGAEDFAVVMLDEHGTISSWNSGAERMMGFTEGEAVGQPGGIFFTLEDREAGAPDHEMSRAQSDGRAVDERWHQRKNGSRFWGSGLTMRLDAPQGGYLKIFRDRTAEHEAEAAMRASQAALEAKAFEFEALAENVSQLAWMAEPDGHIYWYNKRWYEYTGTDLESMQGWGWREVHQPDHVDRVIAEVQAKWARGLPWEGTYRLRSKEGEYRPFLTRVEPIRDGTGTLVRWFGTNTDITAQLRAEERLRELNETLEAQVAERTAERDRIWQVSRDLLGVADDQGVWRNVNPA